MKILYVICLILLLGSTMARREHTYEELINDMRKPAPAVSINSILAHLTKERLEPLIGNRATDIVRDGVGCGSGVFGGLDQAFTVVDIIRRDPTDWFGYVFATIFIFAWWQQNGQFVTYYCGNLWEEIH